MKPLDTLLTFGVIVAGGSAMLAAILIATLIAVNAFGIPAMTAFFLSAAVISIAHIAWVVRS